MGTSKAENANKISGFNQKPGITVSFFIFGAENFLTPIKR
jgi:hypothetical protein